MYKIGLFVALTGAVIAFEICIINSVQFCWENNQKNKVCSCVSNKKVVAIYIHFYGNLNQGQ